MRKVISMEDKTVPYIVYEGTIARFERIIKKLVVVIVLLVITFVATNALWIYEWNQYDYADVTLDGTTGGNATYMGAGSSGVVNNGRSESQEQTTEE